MGKSTVMPFVNSVAEAVELTTNGEKKKYWKKEILPSGTRNYRGRKLDFSKINPACVRAFEDGAFDSVPYVLALSDNEHPKPGQEAAQLEGDLHKVELTGVGSLVGYFDFSNSPDVESRIKKSNGKFGVSARIEVDYEREDTGSKYEYALSHVCGTTRPFIKGMSPWESVELSESVRGGMTIDFTGDDIIDEGETKTDSEDTDMGLGKEDVEWLGNFIKEMKAAESNVQKTDENDETKKQTPVPATLSESDRKAIELSESRANAAMELAEKQAVELAETRWDKQKAELVRDGVPPAVIEAAESVMKAPKKATITLSDTETIDATLVLSEVLNACKGMVPVAKEEGHSYRLSEFEVDDKEYADWAKDWGFYEAPASESK